MKALLLCLLLAAGPALAQQVAQRPDVAEGSLEALDAKDGFRGYHFGDLISQHATLEKRGKHYVDHLEPLLIAGIDLDRLEFYFDASQKLSAVLFSATGAQQPAPLMQAMVAQYGQPQVAGDGQYIWQGQHVTATLTTVMFTANNRYVGVPVKQSTVRLETNEAYRARTQPKGRVLTGTGF